MKLITKVKQIFKRGQPKYGEGIFYQRTWLTREVDDAMYKNQFNHAVALGEVKEQK